MALCREVQGCTRTAHASWMGGMSQVQGRHTGRISVARGQESVATAQERRCHGWPYAVKDSKSENGFTHNKLEARI